MIKQKTVLETKIGDREHVYLCDPSSSLPEVFQALNEFRSYVYGRIKEAEEQAKLAEEKEPKPE